LDTGLLRAAKPSVTKPLDRSVSWFLAFGSLAMVTGGLLPFRTSLSGAHVALALLLVVLVASAWGGRAIGVSIAFAAFLVFNWFFLPPYDTLRLRNSLDWLVLAVFLITSVVAAQLLYSARAERAAVERAEALREADKMKDALVTSLSHDLRTPLTTIKGLAHELQSIGDERTFIIEEQADRLNRIVNDLLDAARLDAGNFPLDLQVNAADDLLGAVVQHVAGRADRNRLAVSLDDPSTLLFGRFDFVHSLRILANLVDNALKYSPEESKVEVTAGLQHGMLVFRVADRGPGIPMDEKERIFTPFNRTGARSERNASVGLGLSISRDLAEAQAGTLTVVDRKGGGVTFELRLPAVDASALG
jgi:two-component system sensor histidine kinase KdpD